jgi:ABC-2 type transport system ATP-binding protein
MSRRGVTVLITTHFMDEAEYCDRLGFISSGRLIALGTPSELRRETVKEDVFSVTLADLSGAKRALQKLLHVVSITYFGQTLHVFTEPGALDVASLEEAVRSDGMDVSDVVRVQPTLEDVFVRLAERDRPEDAL